VNLETFIQVGLLTLNKSAASLQRTNVAVYTAGTAQLVLHEVGVETSGDEVAMKWQIHVLKLLSVECFQRKSVN